VIHKTGYKVIVIVLAHIIVATFNAPLLIVFVIVTNWKIYGI